MRTRTVVVVGLAAVAVAFAVTWAVEPNLIVGLRSPRALGWAAALASACAVVGAAVYRVTRRSSVALVAAALPAVVATAMFVVRPILTPRTLDEALPTSAPVAGSPPVAEAAPAAAAAAPATSTASAAPAAQSGAPVLVASGRLRGLAGHDARGRVATYRLADGSHLIRFEDVDIGGTPSPHVYVVPGADQRKPGGVRLGRLKAEKGSFHYQLPSGAHRDGFTVLVWCEQFAVEIANATQA